MLKPTITPWATAFWKRYFRYIIHADFSAFNYNAAFTVPKGPILLLANHTSWWDGFFYYHLNQKLFKRRFHVLMLEEQLQQNNFLRTAGAFSIDKTDAKDMLKSLQFAGELLQKPENLVLFFPQGRLESAQVAEPSFFSGVKRILAAAPEQYTVVLAATFIDYFEKRKPEVQVYLKALAPEQQQNVQQLKQAFLTHYKESRQVQGARYI